MGKRLDVRDPFLFQTRAIVDVDSSSSVSGCCSTSASNGSGSPLELETTAAPRRSRLSEPHEQGLGQQAAEEGDEKENAFVAKACPSTNASTKESRIRT